MNDKQMGALSGFERILMFFAHPDDETLAAGGTMAALADHGREIHVAIPNTGIHARVNVRGGAEANAEMESLRSNCAEAMGILGVGAEHIHFGDFSDNEADRHTLLELVHWLEPILEKVKPDVVFTHHRFCTNIDHQYCHEAAVVATRPGVDSHTALFCGEVPSSTGYLRPAQWEPNCYVSLTEEQMNRKIAAMSAYKGEDRPYPHPRSREVLRALAQVRGSESGFHFAEAFMISRVFGRGERS